MGVARGSTQWSCSRFTSAGTTYYVSVAAHPAAGAAAEGSVDLAVTDGGRAWIATGARDAAAPLWQAAGACSLMLHGRSRPSQCPTYSPCDRTTWLAGLTSERLAGVQPHDRSRLAHLLAAVSELEQAALAYSTSAKAEADGSMVRGRW